MQTSVAIFRSCVKALERQIAPLQHAPSAEAVAEAGIPLLRQPWPTGGNDQFIKSSPAAGLSAPAFALLGSSAGKPGNTAHWNPFSNNRPKDFEVPMAAIADWLERSGV